MLEIIKKLITDNKISSVQYLFIDKMIIKITKIKKQIKNTMHPGVRFLPL